MNPMQKYAPRCTVANMTKAQVSALQCAVADLIGALQVARATGFTLDEEAVMDTLRDLSSAFPDVSLDIPEDIYEW